MIPVLKGRMPYAPPSLFAYSSSILSRYCLSASFSSWLFSVCVALATLWVAVFSAVCGAEDDEDVDFSADGIGTGIFGL